MIVSAETLCFLIYCLLVNIFVLEGDIVMKHFLKGAAVVAAVLVVSLGIHVFCNMRGIQLDQVMTSVVSAGCAVVLYHILIKNEKK